MDLIESWHSWHRASPSIYWPIPRRFPFSKICPAISQIWLNSPSLFFSTSSPSSELASFFGTKSKVNRRLPHFWLLYFWIGPWFVFSSFPMNFMGSQYGGQLMVSSFIFDPNSISFLELSHNGQVLFFMALPCHIFLAMIPVSVFFLTLDRILIIRFAYNYGQRAKRMLMYSYVLILFICFCVCMYAFLSALPVENPTSQRRNIMQIYI